jgi:diguanylate cyclase (GGDEF)-like protein
MRQFSNRFSLVTMTKNRDPDLMRKGQVLATVLSILALAVVTLGFFNLIQGAWQYNFSNAVFLMLVIALFVLNRSGYVKLAGTLLVALTAATALVVLPEDTTLKTTFIAMTIPILISSFLLVPWGGIIIVTLLVIGSVARGVTTGDYPALLTLVVVAIISYMFARSLDRAYRRSRHDALHDSLTGLPNRALFLDRLRQCIERKDREKRLDAVLFMDLDSFKVINDSLGHKAGDELLIEVARRLESCLRSRDTAARLGGDEFTVLLEEIDDPGDAVRVAQRIANGLRAPFVLGEHEVFMTTSIGIAMNATAEALPDDVMRDADVAMYEAKSEGKARFKVFNEDMYEKALRRLELENELRRAIEGGELRVHYQPKIFLENGSIVGMEALVRWEHPQRGLVPPNEFIPLAEETDLIHPLGKRVLEEACERAREWQILYPHVSDLVMSVNISAKQFQNPDLVGDLARILRASGLAPQHLQLEITESVVTEDMSLATRVMRKLKELGVQLAIDDFGKGYSSLTSLKQFPLDDLKIDRSFVEDVGKSAQDAAIAKLVIDLAHVVGMHAVGEGVETSEQLSQLQNMGCDVVQGYYFYRPLTPDGATELLARGSSVEARLGNKLF